MWRLLILLTDVILFAKVVDEKNKQTSKLEMKQVLFLNSIKIDEDSKDKTKMKNAFVIVHPERSFPVGAMSNWVRERGAVFVEYCRF